MARYINEDEFIAWVREHWCAECNNGLRCRACLINDAIDIVEEAPAADVVEVVRCKDCRLRDTEGCPVMIWDCGELMGETNDGDFCSHGERKE